MSANVFQCGGVLVYQLLCGSAIARDDPLAKQMRNYCYLIVNTLDRTAIALDAAWDVKGIFELAKQLGVAVTGCIYTHSHFDHCGGDVDPAFIGRKIPPLAGAKDVELAGGKIWAGEGDVAAMRKQCNLSGDVAVLHDGDAIECGDLVLHVLGTPGHTPGSVCIFAAPRCLSPRGTMGATSLKETMNAAESGLLLTGDSLFVGSCGATHFPGGSPQEMERTLSRLSKMDPGVVVCPGHAYSDPFSTIGQERRSNPSMQSGMSRVPRPPALPPCFACGPGGSCGPRGFRIGRKMRLAGLSSDAGRALNGQAGVLQFFDEAKGRYAIKMLGSTAGEKLLRPENLEESAASAGGTLLEEERGSGDAAVGGRDEAREA